MAHSPNTQPPSPRANGSDGGKTKREPSPHTRQGVAEPALSKHSPDGYEQDAQRRAAQHQQFWSDEPLTSWQEFILCRELDCNRRHHTMDANEG